MSCVGAARSLATIVNLLGSDAMISKRCWMLIYYAFSGCLLLLYNATQVHLLDPNEVPQDDLRQAKTFMEALQRSLGVDKVAAAYFVTVQPLYLQLIGVLEDPRMAVQHDLNRRASMQITSPVSTSNLQPFPPFSSALDMAGQSSSSFSDTGGSTPDRD